MSSSVIASGGVVVLLLLMVLGMPIAFAMFVTGVGGIILVLGTGPAFHTLATTLWGQFGSYNLAVIPFFILMGQLAYHAGITERMYKTAYAWTGRLPGGVAATTLGACAGFATICGSNTATAATMSSVALPEMEKYNYDPALATGTIAVGGTLGTVIPPSVTLIVIGIQTQQSIRDLFAATFIPGLLLFLLMLATILGLCWFRPAFGPPGQKSSLSYKINALWGTLDAVLLFVLVVIGLLIGWFTPSEAGAIGAFLALCIGVAHGELRDFSKIRKAFYESLRSSAMIMLLVAGAVVFARFLAVTRVPFMVSNWAAALPLSPVIILMVILLIYVIGGALMDALGFLVMSLPVFFPLGVALGFDPVWYAVLLGLVTTVGAVTPPVGVNAFIVSSHAPGVGLEKVFRGVIMYMPSYVVCIALVVAFPMLALWLPQLLR